MSSDFDRALLPPFRQDFAWDISLKPVGCCFIWVWCQQPVCRNSHPQYHHHNWWELLCVHPQVRQLRGNHSVSHLALSANCPRCYLAWQFIVHQMSSPWLIFSSQQGRATSSFSDITLQIRLLALKSLTQYLLLGKLNFDTMRETLNHCTQAVENSLLSLPANSKECAKGWKLWNQDLSLNRNSLKCTEPKEREQESISQGSQCGWPEKHQRNWNGRVTTPTGITLLKIKGKDVLVPYLRTSACKSFHSFESRVGVDHFWDNCNTDILSGARRKCRFRTQNHLLVILQAENL